MLTKLTPNITDIREPGRVAAKAGTDGIALINTIKSIMGLDLETFLGTPSVGGKFTNGGFCGPSVKPIALYMVASLARDPEVNVPLSGMGGISNWHEAAEFLALGATSLQVCTAVMHHGYGIITNMLEGLTKYLDKMGMKSVNDLVGVAIKNFVEWKDLNLNYKVVAEIDPETCIGCQRCYTACLDGGHQCIHTTKTPCSAYHGEHDHAQGIRLKSIPVAHDKNDDHQVHVPFVDKGECVGCNLCSFVCPTNSISMKEV